MADENSTLEMANLVCRFGQKVLLDHFDEIVYPAFTDEELRRQYGQTSFFFEKVDLVSLVDTDGENVIGIAGRFIKDTTLTREQVYLAGEGLVQDKSELQSSPSALFLLILNSHRLVYLKETSNAPDKNSFRSTLLSFLRQTHSKMLKSKLEGLDAEDLGRDEKRERKEEVRENYPRPTLDLIPLTSEESIEQFIQNYQVLNQIKIVLSRRNDEADLDGFFEQMQKAKDAVGSSDTALVHKSKEGLDKDEAVAQVTAATAQGNQNVTLRGSDAGGDTLIGNNERFQLKTDMENVSSEPDEAAHQMYEAFRDLVARGLVVLPKETKKVARVIASIVERYFE